MTNGTDSDAKPKARFFENGRVWIDHATLIEADIEWLSAVERLILWNVRVPPQFLARLPKLWWVDWRGGGAGQGIEQLRDLHSLRYLCLNQIRGLASLSFLTELTSLEMIRLYGLASVTSLPSLSTLSELRRFEIGQMKRPECIGPALQAPNLQELLLMNFVRVTDDDVKAMQSHGVLKAFEWYGPDIPVKMWLPIREAVGLPKTRAVGPEEWFNL